MSKKTIQAYINIGDDSYVSVNSIRKTDKNIKQKVVAYLNKLIKKHKEQIELWQRTIAFIES